MNTSPFISAAMQAELENLLAVEVCLTHEDEELDRWLDVHNRMAAETDDYGQEGYDLCTGPQFNRGREVDDYHPDGRYGWRTTGMRNGEMTW